MAPSSPPPHDGRRARQRVVPVQARSRQRIDAILDATARLLADAGAEAVTTSAIARAAGTTPATLYHYFENRLAVFAALARRTMAEVDAALTLRLTALAASGEVHSGELLAALYQAYRDAPGYVPVLAALRAEPALQELVHESNGRMAEVIADLLAGRTRLAPARARRVARLLSEICEQVLQAALMAGEAEARLLMAELAEMLDVLFHHYREAATPSA